MFFLGYILFDTFYYSTDLDPDIYDAIEFIIGLLPLISVVVGPWLSFRLTGEWIRRRRIRSHRAVDEYRCNHCRMQFLPDNEK